MAVSVDAISALQYGYDDAQKRDAEWREHARKLNHNAKTVTFPLDKYVADGKNRRDGFLGVSKQAMTTPEYVQYEKREYAFGIAYLLLTCGSSGWIAFGAMTMVVQSSMSVRTWFLWLLVFLVPEMICFSRMSINGQKAERLIDDAWKEAWEETAKCVRLGDYVRNELHVEVVSFCCDNDRFEYEYCKDGELPYAVKRMECIWRVLPDGEERYGRLMIDPDEITIAFISSSLTR